MFTCANCAIKACYSGDLEKMPKNCPMQNMEAYDGLENIYLEDENHKIFLESAFVEKSGYRKWNRVRETIDFIKRMEYQNVGIAFCTGLQKEAAILNKLLRDNGIKTTTIICKNGGYSKERFGVPEEMKLKGCGYEAACNPIGQAKMLELAGTDFNIVFGLCVGHDTLFFKYTNTPFTVLVVKDRVLGHNPCVALYGADYYFKDTFSDTQISTNYIKKD